MRLCSLLVCAALAVQSPPLFAQGGDGPTSAEIAAATKKFLEAQKKYEQKDYAASLELSQMALEVSESPNARLYVARSLRELGRFAEAYDEMSITLRDATERAQEESKYVPTRDAAAAELALLQRKIGRVIVAVADPPEGTDVTLDGKPIETERLGQPLAVMPGTISVRATAPDSAPIERKLTLAAGETRTLALAFDGSVPATESEPEPKPVATAEVDTETSGGSLRTIGFVVAGVGVAGMAVFGIAGSMAKSEFDTLESECGSARCTDPKYADNVDSGKRMQTIANVGLVVGALGLVAGGTMIVLGGPKSRETASVMFTPGGVGVGYQKRF